MRRLKSNASVMVSSPVNNVAELFPVRI